MIARSPEPVPSEPAPIHGCVSIPGDLWMEWSTALIIETFVMVIWGQNFLGVLFLPFPRGKNTPKYLTIFYVEHNGSFAWPMRSLWFAFPVVCFSLVPTLANLEIFKLEIVTRYHRIVYHSMYIYVWWTCISNPFLKQIFNFNEHPRHSSRLKTSTSRAKDCKRPRRDRRPSHRDNDSMVSLVSSRVMIQWSSTV